MTAVVDHSTDEETETEPLDAAPSSRRRVGLPRRARKWLVGAGAAVFVVGAGFQSWLLIDQHRDRAAGRAALFAAESYAVTLTTADPRASTIRSTPSSTGRPGISATGTPRTARICARCCSPAR